MNQNALTAWQSLTKIFHSLIPPAIWGGVPGEKGTLREGGGGGRKGRNSDIPIARDFVALMFNGH
jgi:hypothetical protein